MLKALRYEIMRGVEANGRKVIPLAEKPVRVATIINEQDFLDRGGVLIHNENVFLEERWNDYLWENGKFTYFTRVAEVADIIIVYELAPKQK